MRCKSPSSLIVPDLPRRRFLQGLAGGEDEDETRFIAGPGFWF